MLLLPRLNFPDYLNTDMGSFARNCLQYVYTKSIVMNFKACVRNRRKDGLWPVYLRLVHRRKVGYLKTDLLVNSAGLARNGDIKDSYVLRRCLEMIEDYAARLNRLDDIQAWDVLRIKQYLMAGNSCHTFSKFADSFIANMEQSGSLNNAKVYRAAIKSLKDYLNADDIKYDMLTRESISNWISFLGSTRRARTLYPTCVRLIYREAMLMSQDPNSEIAPITYNPWGRISIPVSEVPRKRAVSADLCRSFLTFEIPPECKGARKAQFGQDIAKLSFCLAAINTVDLYKLRKADLKNGLIGYCRSKTSSRRKDGAYIEMRVTSMAGELIEKYRAQKGDVLLSFSERFSNAQSFVAYVDAGIKKLCEIMGMKKDDYLTFYTFRHTWATIARNECGASLSEVGFAMNHLQSDGVTRGYIKPDFTPAWELNENVNSFVFGDAASDVSHTTDALPKDDGFVLRPQMLIRAAAFFQGKCLANFEDIGYSNIEEVTQALVAQFPADIPDRSMVQFKIVNLDSGKVYVYEHQKGKGF